jgi:hypothetical protein
MNEGGGSIVHNLAQKYPKALTTLVNATYTPMGISFNGTSSYVDGTDFFYSNSFSLSAYIYIKGMPADSQEKVVILKRNSSGTSDNPSIVEWAFVLKRNTDASCFIQLYAKNGATLVIDTNSSPYTLSLNTWYRVTFTCNGTNTIISVNNSLVSGNQTGVIGNTVNLIQLGVRDNNNDARYFSGVMGNVEMWNRALSPSEIRSIYTAPYQMIQAPRRVFYSFASGTTTPPVISSRVRGYMTTNRGMW